MGSDHPSSISMSEYERGRLHTFGQKNLSVPANPVCSRCWSPTCSRYFSPGQRFAGMVWSMPAKRRSLRMPFTSFLTWVPDVSWCLRDDSLHVICVLLERAGGVGQLLDDRQWCWHICPQLEGEEAAVCRCHHWKGESLSPAGVKHAIPWLSG